MKVHLWAMGAASDAWVQTGESVYQKRIERYMPFEYKTVVASKSSVPELAMTQESAWVKQQLAQTPTLLVLLDERGKSYTSPAFAQKLETWRQGSHKRVVFLVGSAYGFDAAVYAEAREMISLSPMTLPHQLCRLLFLEQLYRACTILKGESYHHI